MNYYQKIAVGTAFLASAVLLSLLSSTGFADPLPGEILKFQQLPMVTTQIDGVDYHVHDELSSLYGFPDPTIPGGIVTDYFGTSMADDFADPFDTPVVHVRWWGSYLGNLINPDNPIDKFLIAFESDLPADQNPIGNFSRPDQVLSTQIVNRGALAPGSGTFTEKLILSAPAPGEDIYEYNAELHLDKEFQQDPETVYWLKIAALPDVVDANGDGAVDAADLSIGLATGAIPQWGWHNRDYTIPDPFALAVTPPVAPGERDEAVELGVPYPSEVWHFQDDSVSNPDTHLRLDPAMPNMPVDLFQNEFTYMPQNYVDGLDGPAAGVGTDGTTHVGVSQFSKDLAFELYTRGPIIPEPASCVLMLVGFGASLALRRRR